MTGREGRSPVTTDPEARSGRGQLVLLAAVALAIALVPLVLAYLQLGYQDDIHATAEPVPAAQAETALDRGLQDAASGIPTDYAWNNRSAAVGAVRSRLAPTLAAVSTAGLGRGIAADVAYNGTRAASWAGDHCPGGPDRSFGTCTADRGVVVQERGDRTHVLAAAFDVRLTTPDGELRLSTTVDRRSG